MPVYSYDHIHLRTHDPMATAQYYQRMFDAKIVETLEKGFPLCGGGPLYGVVWKRWKERYADVA